MTRFVIIAALLLGATACDSGEEVSPDTSSPTADSGVAPDATPDVSAPDAGPTNDTGAETSAPTTCVPPMVGRARCADAYCTLEWTSKCTAFCDEATPMSQKPWGGDAPVEWVIALCQQ